jgi:hypothetical protein
MFPDSSKTWMNFPIGFRFMEVSRAWSIFPKPNFDKGEEDSEETSSARDLNLLSTSR